MNASFTKMSESTAEDWNIILPEQMAYFKKLPDRILTHLELLTGDYGGFAVDRLQHSSHTALLRPVKMKSMLSARYFMISETPLAVPTMPMSPRRF
jgi:hypothetical protein